MSHENVSGTEGSVIPGTDDAAASCVIFMTTVGWEPCSAPGSVHSNMYWASTLHTQFCQTQSWNWPSPRNPATDKFWVRGKWMKIENKWVNFTNPGPKLEQKTTIVSRGWTLQSRKAIPATSLMSWVFHEPYFLLTKWRTVTSHWSVCDIHEQYVKLLKCLIHDNQSRTNIY